MNKMKLALGAIALFVAAGGAFASAKAHTTIVAYYVDGSSCVETTTECTQEGSGCKKVINGTPQQLFLSNVQSETAPCSQPLRAE